MTNIDEILAIIGNGDRKSYFDTVRYCGLLLEKHSNAPDNMDTYKQLLPEPYFSIQLAPIDIENLIKTLGKKVVTEPHGHELLWALGKAYSSCEPLRYILIWLKKYCQVSDDLTIYQSLISLSHFLWRTDENHWMPEVQKIFNEVDPVPLLYEVLDKDLPESHSTARQLLTILLQ